MAVAMVSAWEKAGLEPEDERFMVLREKSWGVGLQPDMFIR